MEIIISNQEFNYDFGCKLLKLKYDKCPMPELEDFWDDIVPATFEEIAKLENIEERRTAINCYGIERLVKEVKPKLIDSKTLSKTTTYIDRKGKLVTKKFKDTYELFEVSSKYLNPQKTEGHRFNQHLSPAYYVKCKDTSTDRDYLIWIEPNSVFSTNKDSRGGYYENISQINAVQCIAWTITTDVPVGNIEKIVRQGDCILIKPKQNLKRLDHQRHLTEKEYLELLVAES